MKDLKSITDAKL